MSAKSFCPGSLGIREPKPEYQDCPRCGYEAEIWSDEVKRHCPQCGGLIVKGQQASCIDWCQHARLCVGEDTYARVMTERQQLAPEK